MQLFSLEVLLQPVSLRPDRSENRCWQVFSQLERLAGACLDQPVCRFVPPRAGCRYGPPPGGRAPVLAPDSSATWRPSSAAYVRPDEARPDRSFDSAAPPQASAIRNAGRGDGTPARGESRAARRFAEPVSGGRYVPGW